MKQANLVILVVIDCLRADHLHCYGYPRETSPNIDLFASESVRCTQAITAAGWTGASVPSILTGVYPYVHQIRDWTDARNPQIKTIPQLLRSKGFTSTLLTNHSVLKSLDIRDGFDSTLIRLPHELPSDEMTRRALQWIDEKGDNPGFIYLHYFGAHYPYLPPSPYRNSFVSDPYHVVQKLPTGRRGGEPDEERNHIPYVVSENGRNDAGYYLAQYDGAISYTDAQIGTLVRELKRLGVYEDALIILTADHGELLGEHDIHFQHVGCYEGNIKVPLLIKYPYCCRFSNRTESRQVSLIDVFPTIVGTTDAKIPESVQGKPLPGSKHDTSTINHRAVYAEHGYTGRSPHLCIRTDQWKLLSNGHSYFLHDITVDPQEINNMAAVESDVLDELKSVLNSHESATVEPVWEKRPEITPVEKGILRRLGYIE